MDDEQYLIRTVGKNNPFKVPAGYFDELAIQIIEKATRSSQKDVLEVY